LDFTNFTKAQTLANTPQCRDSSGHSKLLHTQITDFTHGEWQNSSDIEACLSGIHKLLNIRLYPPLLSQSDLDLILTQGMPPPSWTSTRHFGPTRNHPGPLHATSLCWVWYNGNGHFVVFYLCPDYWTIIDPLHPLTSPNPTMATNIATAIATTYLHHKLLVPPLPPFLRVNRIAIQNDSPLPAWSCGTIVMLKDHTGPNPSGPNPHR
jgi:hypothetical protein